MGPRIMMWNTAAGLLTRLAAVKCIDDFREWMLTKGQWAMLQVSTSRRVVKARIVCLFLNRVHYVVVVFLYRTMSLTRMVAATVKRSPSSNPSLTRKETLVQGGSGEAIFQRTMQLQTLRRTGTRSFLDATLATTGCTTSRLGL